MPHTLTSRSLYPSVSIVKKVMHDRDQTEVLEEGSQLKWRYAIQTHLSHVINSKIIPTNPILMGGLVLAPLLIFKGERQVQ